MYIHGAVYSPEELLRENLHVHSNFSRCATAEMKLCDIIAEAERAGLERIAIVDHYNNDIDDEIFGAQVDALREQLSGIKTNVKVLIGCELSAYGVGKWLGGEALLKKLDYHLYSCNHYHMPYWEHPEDKSPEGYARHAMDVAESVIVSGQADCIAHPFGPGYINYDVDKQAIVDAITETMLGDLFEKAKKFNTAIEINGATTDRLGLQRKVYNVGREAGVTFNYGTDAHRLNEIDSGKNLELVRRVLLG